MLPTWRRVKIYVLNAVQDVAERCTRNGDSVTVSVISTMSALELRMELGLEPDLVGLGVPVIKGVTYGYQLHE